MAESPTAVESVHDSVPLPLGTSVYIRVIKIASNPIAGSSDKIACDFSIVDVDNGSLYDLNTTSPLAERVEYIALSYMWGEAIADHTISLNGTPFLVRKNLWDFLDRARKDGYEGYIWIDALCINQAKVGERNHQVALMGKIYSHAKGVIVWLGHVGKEIEDAMVTVGRIYADVEPSSSVLKKHRYGFQRLCELEYWTRAWVVQEYVLARKVEIWSNTVKLRTNDRWIYASESNISAWMMTSGDSPGMRIICWRQRHWNLPDTRDKHRVWGGKPPVVEFVNLLFKFRSNMVCADARDRLYSLLSLISPETQKELSINPDYGLSTSELFANVVYSFAQLHLSPETWRGFPTHLADTRSDLRSIDWSIEYDWGFKRDLLIAVVQSLQTMLCLSETDVAVQSVQRLLNDEISLASVLDDPRSYIKGREVTLQSLYNNWSHKMKEASRRRQL